MAAFLGAQHYLSSACGISWCTAAVTAAATTILAARFDRRTVQSMLAMPGSTAPAGARAADDPEPDVWPVPGEHAIAHHLIRCWADGFELQSVPTPSYSVRVPSKL